MTRKIGIVELVKAQLGENFEVGQRLVDIRTNAISMAKLAKSKVDEDGEFAKVYAEQVANMMNDIASVADLAVEKLVKNTN
jgi:hypothetical protein|tara:strand:+ start:576 stop:818 length:243 start_codon:yes stop_codon:yes gene_type:complete